jgi:hypothetical protein
MRLPEDVAELRSLYLRMLRNERVLLILDNALDGDQVAPLLTRGLRPDRHVAAADRGGRCGVRVDSTLAPEAQHAAVRVQSGCQRQHVRLAATADLGRALYGRCIG